MCSCWWGEWASCSFLACARVGLRSLSPCVWVVPGVFCVGVRGRALGGCVAACVCGCARECDWVARALLVLRLMGVWVVVCSACVGFVRLPARPVRA